MDVNNKVSNIANNNIGNISNKTANVNTSNIQKTSNNTETKNNKETKNNVASEKNNVSKETLDKLIKEVNNKFRLANKEFSYDIHEKTNRITVKIKDSETGDVIKEIPSEESLDLAAKIKEMAGLLVDEKS